MERKKKFRGHLGSIEASGDVQRALQLVSSVDLVAADEGAWSSVMTRYALWLTPPDSTGSVLWGESLPPRLCSLEAFKEMQRRERQKQLRGNMREEQPPVPPFAARRAETTAVVFVSSFLEKALPALEALVRLLPSLRRLTLCCFFSVRDALHKHPLKPSCSSLSSPFPSLRKLRASACTPDAISDLTVETLYTPLHANTLTKCSFLMAASPEIPLITADSTKRLLSATAAEERLLQWHPSGAALAPADADQDVQLEDLALENLPLHHREAYSTLASRLAECCVGWGCLPSAVHCSGAASRLLGRAVAERVAHKSRRMTSDASAFGGGPPGEAQGRQQDCEVVLLIVDRILDMQGPLAFGSLLMPSAPPDGGSRRLSAAPVSLEMRHASGTSTAERSFVFRGNRAQCASWESLMKALVMAFSLHKDSQELLTESFPQLPASSSITTSTTQEGRLTTLLLLQQLLKRVCAADACSWRFAALQAHVALWPLLEFVEELLLPAILLAADWVAAGPDAAPPDLCSRCKDSCTCWKCLMEKFPDIRSSSNGGMARSAAIATRLWSVQQARASLTDMRQLSPIPHLLDMYTGAAEKVVGAPGSLRGPPWLLSLARALKDTPGETSAFADAPQAEAPLLEGFLKRGISTMSFLWGVAKSGAEAVAGRDRSSPEQKPTTQTAPRRSVIVFVLGGLAPAELQAFETLETNKEDIGCSNGTPFLVGSTCLTSPARLASALFGDLIDEQEASQIAI
ncbi:hypothetical protein cyc_05712 [Cyclospora cayetanensis]|uniref:Sec1 family domain-containing protein n=2 Tax=Cyclospora cayetanensis TaxID=88456 RepID=A0A1D3D7W4_9EIME|nr:hypothetical protein cyc_05712 [Cyclospora cayetanensis]